MFKESTSFKFWNQKFTIPSFEYRFLISIDIRGDKFVQNLVESFQLISVRCRYQKLVNIRRCAEVFVSSSFLLFVQTKIGVCLNRNRNIGFLILSFLPQKTIHRVVTASHYFLINLFRNFIRDRTNINTSSLTVHQRRSLRHAYIFHSPE